MVEGAYDFECTNFASRPAAGTYPGAHGPINCYPVPYLYDCHPDPLSIADRPPIYCTQDPRSYSTNPIRLFSATASFTETFVGDKFGGSGLPPGTSITIGETCGDNPYGPYGPSSLAQSLPPFLAMEAAPAATAAEPAVTVRPAIREFFALSAAVKTCPHRTAPACGCASVPGSCGLGKGGKRGVTFHDCLACQRDDGVVIRGHLNGYTGYGQHIAAIGRELENLGAPVAYDPIHRENGGFVPLSDFVKARVTS